MANILDQAVAFVDDDGVISYSTIDDIVRFPNMADRSNAIIDLFSTCCSNVSCTELEVPDAFSLNYEFEGDSFNFILGIDGVTPPGKGRSAEEYRLQPRGKQIRFVYNQKDQGVDNYWLGIYRRENSAESVFCAWKSRTTESDESNALYKINAETIADAMKYGFARELRNRKKCAVCAFKVEFLPVFLKNKDYFLTAPNDDNITAIKRNRAEMPYNLIVFGAPGTGKSYQLREMAKKNGFDSDTMQRVTLYPGYTYSQFVGCFKPYSGDNGSGEQEIAYRFVPGPFLDMYMKARLHPQKTYLLVVEEINRSNPAEVFGDIFQLLDRDSDGLSVYEANVPMEMRDCLEHAWVSLSFEEKQSLSNGDEAVENAFLSDYLGFLRLPSNLYIWCTMNSADQGVFPMDTAFKRRWDFRYISIDAGQEQIQDVVVPLPYHDGTIKNASWNELRHEINALLKEAGVNEDKFLGPFFISPYALEDSNNFLDIFESKVLLYLYEDAAKHKRSRVFASEKATYSEICANFKEEGMNIFRGISAEGIYLDGRTGNDEE